MLRRSVPGCPITGPGLRFTPSGLQHRYLLDLIKSVARMQSSEIRGYPLLTADAPLA